MDWKETSSYIRQMVKEKAGTNPAPSGDIGWLAKSAALTIGDVASVPSQTFGWTEGNLNKLWGGPRPLATMLAGSALGAGAGYGAGWLTEKLMPGVWEKKRLRRLLGAIGGAIGAIPGAWQAYDNSRMGGNVLDKWPMELSKASSLLDKALEKLKHIDISEKSAELSAGGMLDFDPSIDRKRLNELIWDDPYITKPIAAATTGLVDAASENREGAKWISPWDVTRIAVGMGSGLASGLLVGKTLGAIAGLTDPAQKKLQQAGVIAGLVTNVVPMAFGSR